MVSLLSYSLYLITVRGVFKKDLDFSEQEQGQCKDDADDKEDDGEEDGHGARDLGCGGPHHSQKPKKYRDFVKQTSILFFIKLVHN